MMKRALSIIIVTCIAQCSPTIAQQAVTLDEVIEQALLNNKSIQTASLDIEYQQQIKRTLTDIGKTNLVYMRGQYNSYVKEDNNITIAQSIPFPTVFTSQNTLGKSLIKGSQLRKSISENELVYRVKQVYYQLQYLTAQEALLIQLDSIYEKFVGSADLRYRTGESALLEKTTAETQQNEARNQLAQARADVLIHQNHLAILIGSSQSAIVVDSILRERTLDLPVDSLSTNHNPSLDYLKQQVEVASNEKRVANAKFLPDIMLGYFNQTLIGGPMNSNGDIATSSDRFQGFEVGLSIPLWFGPQSAKVKAADIHIRKAQAQFEYSRTLLTGEWQQGVQEYVKNRNSINYYQTSALKNAALILKQSDLAYRNGEIGYTEYWLTVRGAMQIREGYLRSLNDLNQSIITLEFLAGAK